MVLVRAGAEVIVRKHCADGAVLARAVEQRVGPPSLYGRLRADKIAHSVAVVVRPCAKQRVDYGVKNLRAAACVLESVVCFDALLNFAGRESAVLIVPAVARAVRRRNVELHEVDVLAHRVCRREYLEVIQVQNVRYEVSCRET